MKIKRGTAAKWKTTNPILAASQFGYEKDTGQLKIGDGLTSWNLLDYTVIRNNMSALRNPVSTDNSYSPGALWFNQNAEVLWVCKGVSENSATWVRTQSGYGN